jgi:hypothetical protein
VLDSQLEAARAFQQTMLASHVGARLNDGKGKINRTAGANATRFPNSNGALPIVPVTPGANLTGTGIKSLGRTRPPNRELGCAPV